jgi:outer membrane protein OmpA-like peptidoglycan-associated protein
MAGTTVNPCQAFLDDDFVVQGVDVLWHRLGTNGLIRFPSRPLGQQDNASRFNFQFEPLNANFTILKTSRPAISCAELGIDSLFGAGSATLRPAAELILRRDLDWIKSLKVGELVRIGLHGGDSMVGADGATSGLTIRRAQALHTFLAASYDLPDPVIIIADHGTSEPKLVCPKGDGPAEALCKKINRRIEVSRYDPNVQ